VYLHYLFDLWADVWRKKVAKGDVIVVRYADDLVVRFSTEQRPNVFCKSFENDWRSSAWNYNRTSLTMSALSNTF
jgi:hypothetical protein